LYEHGASKVDDHLYLGVLILAGFFVQIVLEAFTMGVEHGHAHHVHGHLPVSVLAGLCLHAFVEALALGDPHRTYDPASRSMLLWSIVLHNYPVSIALLGMLLSSGLKESRALWFLGLFAIMAPLGVTISTFTPLANHSRELMAVVIGIFMHISTTILFESSDGHRFNQRKTMAIVLGTALGFLSVFLHG
jgi:zinc transporter ZupT